jgi:hypothetical protein
MVVKNCMRLVGAAVVAICLFIGCDPIDYVDIIVDNNSSYDLHVTFTARPHEFYWEFDGFDLATESDTAFFIEGTAGCSSPHFSYIKEMLFQRMDDRSTLNEVINDKHFVETSRTGSFGSSKYCTYLLEITDELLGEN